MSSFSPLSLNFRLLNISRGGDVAGFCSFGFTSSFSPSLSLSLSVVSLELSSAFILVFLLLTVIHRFANVLLTGAMTMGGASSFILCASLARKLALSIIIGVCSSSHLFPNLARSLGLSSRTSSSSYVLTDITSSSISTRSERDFDFSIRVLFSFPRDLLRFALGDLYRAGILVCSSMSSSLN